MMPLLMGLVTLWWRLESLERLHRGAAGDPDDRPYDDFADREACTGRVDRVRSALFLSGLKARHMLGARLPGIDLSTVIDVLLNACKDAAVCWGGSVLVGGAIGGAVAWIGKTSPMEHDAYHLIARSAFGDLYFWGECSGRSLTIYAPAAPAAPRVSCLVGERTSLGVRTFFSGMTRRDNDLNDLFVPALKKLGRLRHDEMDGFVPALALGGGRRRWTTCTRSRLSSIWCYWPSCLNCG